MNLPTAIEQMKAQPRPSRLPELGSVEPLPEFAIPLVPGPVEEANEAFRVWLEKLDHARHLERQAAQAVEAAEWADQEAARKAAESKYRVGEHPKAGAPAARERHEEAKRAVPAHEHHARVALDAYLAAVRKHADQINDAAADKEATAAAQLAQRMDDVEDLLLGLAELRTLRQALSPPPAGRHPLFAVRRPRRLPSDLAKPIEALRGRLGTVASRRD
jgi:hypothetical protein